MSYNADDTICAVATASGGAARGIVRVSGRSAIEIVERCYQLKDGGSLRASANARAATGAFRVALDDARQLTNSPLARPHQGAEFALPCELFLWPTRRSYTREPVAELHTLGSLPLLQAIVDALCREGARLAEPGEFTLRAFLAGRLDLTQAEAVLGVIDAHGADELRTALDQLAGGLARPLNELRDRLLQLLAELEAGLDFVEEDIQFVSQQELLARIEGSISLLAEVAAQMSTRHVARDLRQVALVGPPNVGKSSLFNALVARYGETGTANRRQIAPALVSPQRGTTRDYLTAAVTFDGVLCELVDTAGIFEIADCGDGVTAIDAAAESHSENQRARAAVRAVCVEASASAGEIESKLRCYEKERDCDILVITKVDAAPVSISNTLISKPVVVTSSHTGVGLTKFCEKCRTLLSRELTTRGPAVTATADRCRESVRRAENALQSARDLTESAGGDELVAVELRAALTELGKVVGAVYTDDLLDRIFKTFCIGK
jgi:tRNA modification GTPase